MSDRRACGCDWEGPPCDHELVHKETGRVIKHAAIAENDERHAEAMRSVRARAEAAESECARLRQWLSYLVTYIRDDQCPPEDVCECCPDYLSVAEHCARRAFEPGVPLIADPENYATIAVTKRAPRVDWDPPCDDRACSLAVELDALRKVAEAAEVAVMCTVRHQGLRDALDAWRKLRVT